MKCSSYYFFTVISNKTRWNIIDALYVRDLSVNEISETTKIEQSKVSHALKTLYECGIVFSKRKGKQKIYTLNKKTIRPILKILETHMTSFCDGHCKMSKKGVD